MTTDLLPSFRRAMALKALDQRLANPAQNPGASSPLPHNPSSHHPASPANELPNSHSHSPPRQHSTTPPQTHGPSAASQQAKPGSLPLHGAKTTSGAPRGEASDGEADLGVAGDKSVKGSAPGTLPT